MSSATRQRDAGNLVSQSLFVSRSKRESSLQPPIAEDLLCPNLDTPSLTWGSPCYARSVMVVVMVAHGWAAGMQGFGFRMLLLHGVLLNVF